MGPIFFILGKIGQNNRLAPPPLQLAIPPLGNPGFATEKGSTPIHNKKFQNVQTNLSFQTWIKRLSLKYLFVDIYKDIT